MEVLDENFLHRYFTIDCGYNEPDFFVEPFNRRFNFFFNLKTYKIKEKLNSEIFTIDFIFKSLIFSLIQKSIYRFSPENYLYIWYSKWPNYHYGFFVYRHTFSNGSDVLIENLSLRYGLDYSSHIAEKMNDYIEFTIALVNEEISPFCITNFNKIFLEILNHEEFKCEFSNDPNSNSFRFYKGLKLKYTANVG